MNAGQDSAADLRASARAAVRVYAHSMIATAALWDVLGTVGLLPPWWPPVSYVLAGAGMTAACVAALVRILQARGARRTAGVGGQLLAIGLLLGAWLLRGHAEIEPDMPIVAAEVVSAALYGWFGRSRS